MDIFLIIVSSVIGVLLIGINFYLLALYCHPDDRGFGASLFCKIVVVLGLTLSWAQVLLMPMDVANNNGIETGGLDMKICWYIIYMTILGMVVVLLPFAQFFYETDDEKTMGIRIRDALLLEFCTICIVAIALFIGYTYLSTAEIPVNTSAIPFANASSGSSATTAATEGQENSTTILKIPVSFPIFAMGMMAFVGWFFFLVFGGVGLSALPLDMINSFLGRPKLISSKDAALKKSSLKKQTQELIEQGNRIKDEENELKHTNGFMNKRKKKGQVETEYRKFKNMTLQLEKDHEIFVLELDYMNTNPVVYWIQLFLGCIFIIISLLWWFQILLYMLLTNSNGFPLSPFLNVIFTYLETTVVSFIGTILLAFFCIYLLWCTQKGNIKFGVRIPFLFTLHPMKVNDTLMNTFLFNVNLILIASVAVTQFCCQAFSQYTRNSEISLIFQQQIRYLTMFKWCFANNIFEYTLLIWSAIVALYLIIKPADRPRALVEMERAQKEKKEIELGSKK